MILADAIGNNGNKRGLISHPAPETVAEAPLPPPPGQLATLQHFAWQISNFQSTAPMKIRSLGLSSWEPRLLWQCPWRYPQQCSLTGCCELWSVLVIKMAYDTREPSTFLRPSGTPPRSGTAPMIIVFTSVVARMHNLKRRVKVELPKAQTTDLSAVMEDIWQWADSKTAYLL